MRSLPRRHFLLGIINLSCRSKRVGWQPQAGQRWCRRLASGWRIPAAGGSPRNWWL